MQIQFTSDVLEAIEGARAMGTLPEVGLPDVDAVLGRYPIASIERVVPAPSEGAEPINPEDPSLMGLYQLTFTEEIDGAELVSSLEQTGTLIAYSPLPPCAPPAPGTQPEVSP